MGTALYDAGKYEKANRLFLQIVPKYRGKPQAEKLMYMHSKAFYETKDYFSANYRMERFVEAYPKSERVDEIAFLAAKSYFANKKMCYILSFSNSSMLVSSKRPCNKSSMAWM